ncbi:DNA polymerase III subunit gamma/tau [Endozoicomonas sp. GU-1]|uniref:DNA polymerase III subunit gamma/tau n=1 Tax=Endozoicomonas sp. GU-1 TaxID=3009078 RepID=UPI00325FCBD6
MSYQVLARKWRPRSFKELVGQSHVLQALVNALDQDRLHHAYLFTGTRGVGKTTIARIFARCLNCEQGVSSTPCGQCSACKEIDDGRFVDLIEVDAASRTKVEDTRELLDNVQYAPTRGRYKVYLIDEVHMLSAHSFNALLKTLEEPPPHVKFLLATTDPQKLPVTILSRCLQFSLKNMTPERIVGHLENILGQEQIPCEVAALWQLARAADGSMRDALSLTDQAIAFGNGRVSEAEVGAMLGTIDQGQVMKMVMALATANAAHILGSVSSLAGTFAGLSGGTG